MNTKRNLHFLLRSQKQEASSMKRAREFLESSPLVVTNPYQTSAIPSHHPLLSKAQISGLHMIDLNTIILHCNPPHPANGTRDCSLLCDTTCLPSHLDVLNGISRSQFQMSGHS